MIDSKLQLMAVLGKLKSLNGHNSGIVDQDIDLIRPGQNLFGGTTDAFQ